MSFTKVPSLEKPLSAQISGIKSHFPLRSEISGVLLTGSSAVGEATYRSDIDLFVILRDGPLNYSRVQDLRDHIETHYEKIGKGELLKNPLPVQITVILLKSYQTDEPAMREALRKAKILIDKKGELKRKTA